MTHTLEADSIQLDFNGRAILSSVYLKMETGKVTALLGRNGEGKTCLLNIIYGSLTCEKSVRYNQQFYPAAYRCPDILRYLPQFNFIPQRLSLKSIFNDFEVEYSVFEQVFPDFSSRYTRRMVELSGGERRLVELYVILKSKSKFVMLDEPFTQLSPLQIDIVKELLLEEKKSKGLLITDHLYQQVLQVCDDVYLLSNSCTTLINDIRELERLGYAKIPLPTT